MTIRDHPNDDATHSMCVTKEQQSSIYIYDKGTIPKSLKKVGGNESRMYDPFDKKLSSQKVVIYLPDKTGYPAIIIKKSKSEALIETLPKL